MNPREVEYWDSVAVACHKNGGIVDNWLKRQVILRYLMQHNWVEQDVLEIGVGAGFTAGMLMISCGNTWRYIGTEMSPHFIKLAADQFALNVVQADVLSLPQGKFDRILALDSLEHVAPADREQGYLNIACRMKQGGLLFINIPPHRSLHDAEFDHGFGLDDLHRLEANGVILVKYETYKVNYKSFSRKYAFAVMERQA